jgi:hypothetical protein
MMNQPVNTPSVDTAAAFSQLFQPKAQFPKWFQVNKNIGPVLCQTQEEWDYYEHQHDWIPKPLPGSDQPAPKPLTLIDVNVKIAELDAERQLLAAEREAMRQEMAVMRTMLERVGTPALAHGAGAALAHGAGAALAHGTPTGADVPGGLSDTSASPSEKPIEVIKKK